MTLRVQEDAVKCGALRARGVQKMYCCEVSQAARVVNAGNRVEVSDVNWLSMWVEF